MFIRSISIGKIEPLDTPRGKVPTGIRKRPISGPIQIGIDGLNGDHQADRAVHGGGNKAVYLFPSEHHARWKQFLARDDLSDGFFGENLTSVGVTEHTLCFGDQLEIGTSVLVVRAPRLPCYKFAALLENTGAARFMLNELTTGIYLSVERPGSIAPGDRIHIRTRLADRIPVADYVDAMMQRSSPDRLARLIANEALPDDRKQLLLNRIESRYDGGV